MAKPRSIIRSEEGAELQRLRKEYLAASARAAAVIGAVGMSSAVFALEEAKVAAIVRQIKKILGTTGQPWNA
jgi:hypothetical protein